MDLYANVRPVKSVEGHDPRMVDMTIVRENTECLVSSELSYFLSRFFEIPSVPSCVVHRSPQSLLSHRKQYVKQETIEDTPAGRVARATRQISERASTRIGRMAMEIALAAAEVKKQRGGSYGWTVSYFSLILSRKSRC